MIFKKPNRSRALYSSQLYNAYGKLAPKERSSIRLYFGKKYYRTRRYCQWLKNRYQYAKRRKADILGHVVITHQTPLYRELRDVDRWLQENKVVNLQCALSKINGICIYPGETFSYWRLIGKPTYRKGYRDGMVLHYGHFGHGVGGGLCQLSNMVYWMALHTPLTVTERHRHSFDVFPDSNRKLPFGSGATCVYNYRDLQIKNETDQIFQMCFHLDETHLNGAVYTDVALNRHYEIYEQAHTIVPQSWGGYVRHNIIYRRIFDSSGALLQDEPICENNALMMYEPLLASSE
jgi:vancomycin resistance protein VanW